MREAFEFCRNGDVLVVARLDRLGRSLRELIGLVGELEERGVGFRGLDESLRSASRRRGLDRDRPDLTTNPT